VARSQEHSAHIRGKGTFGSSARFCARPKGTVRASTTVQKKRARKEGQDMKRKDQRPLSLYPLKFDDVIAAVLEVKPEPKSQKKKTKKRERKG
jgi:hypothetical protein